MLDEATSNVDYITDRRIQQVLNDKFRDCTLLTIEHRIHSIVDDAKIILLGNGQIVECETPQKL